LANEDDRERGGEEDDKEGSEDRRTPRDLTWSMAVNGCDEGFNSVGEKDGEEEEEEEFSQAPKNPETRRKGKYGGQNLRGLAVKEIHGSSHLIVCCGIRRSEDAD
jgi:hypothetical protein